MEVLSRPHEVTSQEEPTPAYIVRLRTTSSPDNGSLTVAYGHELQETPERFLAQQRFDQQYSDNHPGRGMTARIDGVIHNGTIITAMRKHAADPIYGIRLDNGEMTILHGAVFLDRVRD